MNRARMWIHDNRLVAGLTAFCVVLILALGGLVLSSVAYDRAGSTAAQAKRLAQQAQDQASDLRAEQARNHAARLADQARTDAEIRGIVTCILAARTPAASVACLREFVAEHPVPALPNIPAPTQGPTSSPTPAKPTPGVSTRPRATVTVRPAPRTSTVTTRAPTPKPTPTPTPTPTPKPVPTSVCGIVHVPIVCPQENP